MKEIKKDILILGGGFAGFSCFREIDRSKRDVCLLTPRNHFLFTPLLPLALSGTVEVRSIIESVHRYEKKSGEVLIGSAEEADQGRKIVRASMQGEETRIHYETLVIAVGAETSTFSLPGVREHALFLREMKHARILRERILRQFDRAAARSKSERKAMLTFVIVGGGATGVEAACEVEDLLKRDLSRSYPELCQEAEIHILEATGEILAGFDRTLSAYVRRRLEQKRIRLHTNTAVSRLENGCVRMGEDRRIESETVIWAAGNTTVPFLHRFAEAHQIELKKGRLPVDMCLQVPQVAGPCFALGDAAAVPDGRGGVLPATAQVASRQGHYLARRLNGREKNVFSFGAMGMLASLGHGEAIADLGWLKMKGALAWWFWKAAYLTKLVSFRNKLSVAFDWLRVRLFGRNTARVEYEDETGAS